MKTIILLVAFVGVVGLGTGCKPSNRVAFKPALMSVDLGEGWARLNIPAIPPVCSPSLAGKGGMINALLLEDDTDINKAADELRTAFSKTGRAIPDSFKQENFSTDTGLPGIHISYTGRSKADGPPDMRSHSFVTHNMLGKCVAISYITSPEKESPAVLEAIQKTLRVE
jgi:hypothetical protein